MASKANKSNDEEDFDAFLEEHLDDEALAAAQVQGTASATSSAAIDTEDDLDELLNEVELNQSNKPKSSDNHSTKQESSQPTASTPSKNNNYNNNTTQQEQAASVGTTPDSSTQKELTISSSDLEIVLEVSAEELLAQQQLAMEEFSSSADSGSAQAPSASVMINEQEKTEHAKLNSLISVRKRDTNNDNDTDNTINTNNTNNAATSSDESHWTSEDFLETRVSTAISNILNRFGKILDVPNPNDLVESQKKQLQAQELQDFEKLKPSLQRKLLLMESTIDNLCQNFESVLKRNYATAKQAKKFQKTIVKRDKEIEEWKQKLAQAEQKFELVAKQRDDYRRRLCNYEPQVAQDVLAEGNDNSGNASGGISNAISLATSLWGSWYGGQQQQAANASNPPAPSPSNGNTPPPPQPDANSSPSKKQQPAQQQQVAPSSATSTPETKPRPRPKQSPAAPSNAAAQQPQESAASSWWSAWVAPKK